MVSVNDSSIQTDLLLDWTEVLCCIHWMNRYDFVMSIIIGARKHGQGGTAPWKCCQVFCVLSVTVKRSVDQLFKHYFHNFLEGRSGSFSSFGMCFEGDD